MLRPCPAALALGLLLPLAAAAADREAVETDLCATETRLDQALAGAVPATRPVDLLTRLAWPDAGPVDDPRIAAAARARLLGYGAEGIQAFRDALRRAPERYHADMASALLETRLVPNRELESDYLPALEDYLWFGSVDAQRMVVEELARYGIFEVLPACVDAMIEHPELTKTVIAAAVTIRHDTARHFLETIIRRDDDRARTREAIEALASIGARAMESLRPLVLSESREIREIALDALIPASSPDDLTTLYEYVTRHPDDDPARVAAATQRAIQLETLLEAERGRRPEVEF